MSPDRLAEIRQKAQKALLARYEHRDAEASAFRLIVRIDIPALLAHIEEQDAELDRATALHFAVGQHARREVPEDVYEAWSEPERFRRDALVRQEERIEELQATVSRLKKESELREVALSDLQEKIQKARSDAERRLMRQARNQLASSQKLTSLLTSLERKIESHESN